MTVNSQLYLHLKNDLINNGYADEINWQTELKECSDSITFQNETCWVILNSGMKEQIARKIWIRINEAWVNSIDISVVFKHKGKVDAIKFVKENSVNLFEKYCLADDKIEFLKTIPFIGKITCFHLAKNLGHDCIKPDRHLVRLANENNTTPTLMCEKISKETGDKVSLIDIILWRSCNLKII